MTKIYAISDLHGKLDFTVPDCDLLLVAGDLCPDFAPGTSYGSSLQENWLNSKWLNWINLQPCRNKWLATFGNHDFISSFNAPAGFIIDRLVYKDGLSIWLSPWSNTFGGWAWMAPAEGLKTVYDEIPEGTNIIVSHQPPYGYGDQVPENYRFSQKDIENEGHVGSRELLETIDRVKPKAVICGHIHSGYGQYQYGETTIYNVSLVNEQYQRVNEPTEIIP